MKNFSKQLLNLIKLIWLQLNKESDFYKNLFDPVIDLPDYRQIIDNVPTTEDIPIDDDLFSDKENEDNSKQIKDDIWNDINHSEILINMN